MITIEPVKVMVNRTLPFVLPESFTKECGKFTIDPEYQDKILPDSFEFSIEDISIFSVENPGFPSEPVNAMQFREQIMRRADYLPLDAHCAMAIFSDIKMRRAVRNLWFKQYGYLYSNHRLKTLNFFGSMALDHFKKVHVISLKYEPFNVFAEEILMTYEADDKGWYKKNDYAIVFTKEATKRILGK